MLYFRFPFYITGYQNIWWLLTNYVKWFPRRAMTLSFTKFGYTHACSIWARVHRTFPHGLWLLMRHRHASVVGRGVTDSLIKLVVQLLTQLADMWRLLQIVVSTLHISELFHCLRLIHLQASLIKHLVHQLFIPVLCLTVQVGRGGQIVR